MEDDSSESIVTEHNISSPVSSAGHVDNVSSPMLPLETNVNTDVTIDTSAAASTPSSTVSSDTQEQQQHWPITVNSVTPWTAEAIVKLPYKSEREQINFTKNTAGMSSNSIPYKIGAFVLVPGERPV